MRTEKQLLAIIHSKAVNLKFISNWITLDKTQKDILTNINYLEKNFNELKKAAYELKALQL